MKFSFFYWSYLELAQIALGENYYTPSGHMQSLCEVRTSNVSLIER